MRPRVLVVACGLLAMLAACASPRYVLRRPGMPCDRALRVAHRTMVGLGYTITELSPGGGDRAAVISGQKVGPDGTVVGGSVRIHCDANGAVLQPEETSLFPTYEFSRGFGYSFRELVQRPDVEEPAKAIGLQVLIEAITPFQAQLDLGSPATSGDHVLVRVTVRNHTDRGVRVQASGIALVGENGTPTHPLENAATGLASGIGGDTVRTNLLTTLGVPAHTSVTRYLVYPPGRYSEANVSVEDTETGETDGFVTRVE